MIILWKFNYYYNLIFYLIKDRLHSYVRIYNEKDLNVLIEQFIGEDIGNYLLKTTKNANIVFVYGNREKVYSLTYLKANTGNIGVGGADWRPTGSFSKKRNIPVNSLDKTIELNIEVTEEKGTRNYKYLFDLRDNEMFYLVILNANI